MRAVVSARINGFLFSNPLARVSTSVRCLSLSELAKAFTELSESSGAPVAKEPAPAAALDEARAQAAFDMKSAPLTRSGNDLGPLNKAGHSRLRNSRDTSNSGAVTFSAAYSKRLSEMSGAQIAFALEKKCRQQHIGQMLQCLVEVWRRLREASLMGVIITDEEARGEEGGGNVALTSFRSDLLLEGVLRALAKTNLDEVQQSSRLVRELGYDGISVEWVTEFGYLLMQWLAARVASLSPFCSATFLHLIAQQKVFHSDAVLETLRDNIEVHIARDAVRQAGIVSSSSSSSSSRISSSCVTSAESDREFDVRAFAVLLDAMARWQAKFVRLLGGDGPGLQIRLHDGRNTTATITRRQHPILNASFYNVVVDGLLRGVRDGSLHLIRQGSPSTFFFLTLALAKIRWFRADCAEVLLPQLHEALRVFSGQYLGVVLLLGRREVKACNVETTELLLQTLLDTVQKRGKRYISADERRRHGSDSVALQNFLTTMQSAEDFSWISTSVGHEGVLSTAMAIPDMDTDDEDLQLLSASPPLESVGRKDFSHSSETGAINAGASSHSSPAAFATSFMDLRSVPVLIDSLNHILTTTLEHCRVQGQETQRNAVDVKARALYEALLNDTHGGVKSLHALQESPALVEKLLSSVLRIPYETNHPLIIELAYVFTRHVGARHVALQDIRKSTVAAPHWQWRAMSIVELLVQHGVIVPETYVMTDSVIQSAPRVLSAVEAEKKRLLERHHERQQQCGKQQGREKKKKKTVRTSEVFARFSRIVVQLKQQM
ncbi:hypothetical protein MOQ_003269 [Trypanosoma cruzi marinkellei]|uniref:Uncharacterized protein n=1 Tax=Trypanosoma cruzi marinkellei TaxID=85056 RepID=K2N4I6_TRYCR|nr:hypothetical protein MOQ_003269 [Trypanosoma cruzi marinkellei]